MPTSEAGVVAMTGPAPTRGSLTRAACLALLASGSHGRVAATMRAVPIIIPVRFTLVGDDIVFTPGPGEGQSRAVAHSVVAFETDHLGANSFASWSVHVTGVARPMITGDPEAPGFRLSCDVLTGWRGDT